MLATHAYPQDLFPKLLQYVGAVAAKPRPRFPSADGIDLLVSNTDSVLELTAVAANGSVIEEAFHLADKVYCYLHPSDIVVVQGE